MKTIKNILYLLVAAGAIALVGCVKDETYTKGGDLDGERIYIDNSKSVFYVQTAEEKAEENAQLAKLSRGLKQNIESTDDDKSVTLNLCRLNSKLATYTTTVELTLPSDSYQLFTLPAGATQSGAGAETVIYSFEVSFDEGANKAPVEIGFDIDALEQNVEYEMNLKIADDGNTSNYGASSFDFVICHAVEIELPFTDIGTITRGEDWAWECPSYSGIIIQLHNDDLKAIKDGKGASLPYLRLYIPRYEYQLAVASIAEGDGFFTNDKFGGVSDDEVLEYFAKSDGILFTMSTKYEPMFDLENRTYPHPVYPDTYGDTGYVLQAMAGINSVTGDFSYLYGNTESWAFVQYQISNEGIGIVSFFTPMNGSTATRSVNKYTYTPWYYMVDLSGGWGAQDWSFTWDTNELEDDWDNYFSVDYNNSIDYVKAAGSGTFSSTAFPTTEGGESKPQTWNQDLYVGYDTATSQQVYYLPNVYQTVLGEEKDYGLAALVNGSAVTVASGQPLGMQWNGNEIYAQQSEKINSSIEFAEDGSLKKLTLGVAFVLENGNILADYTETYEFNSSASGAEAFFGTYTQAAYKIYSPYYGEDGKTELEPQPSPISSTVTISQALDSSNKPVAGKVFIEGLVDSWYISQYGLEDGRLVGEYDATSNCIIVPAQYLYKPEWDLGVGFPILPYFQPGVGTYTDNKDYADTPEEAYYMSMIAAASESCALYLDDEGNLTLGFSTTDTTGNLADSYAIQLNYLDQYLEFSYYGDLYVAIPAAGPITFTRATASGSSVKAQSAVKHAVKNYKVVKASNKSAAAYEFKEIGKSINPEQLGR